ncbi:MAG: DUF4290 domain-containing protein [Muribaculaceae bacterium]|nr:DUF4290 domain-containing protein [Muribaculaceae bacterium]
MLTYNTQQKALKLPEYGRNIQQMIDHCLSIEDRDERTRCAGAIVEAMAVLFPAQVKNDPDRKKFWDHLAIMSDFKLDIDYPFEIVKPDDFATPPTQLNYTQERFSYRHYGRYIERMIATALTIEDEDARHELALQIAEQMKKRLMEVNEDAANDARIFGDLANLSGGRLRLSTTSDTLHSYILPPVTGKKKKKK